MGTKFCSNCGYKLSDEIQFCPNCGLKITIENTNSKLLELDKINKRIALHNNQSSIVKKAWYAAALFFILTILPFQEWSPVTGAWALAFISFFLFLFSLVVVFMFRSREKKLETLITGEKLLANWVLSQKQKEKYVSYLFKQEIEKNKIILLSISFAAIIVWGIFILFIDEGKLAMVLILLGLLIFLSLFAFGMPYYYKIKNRKGDGHILIGTKFAYINGFFHNWDFPLSGLKKIKVIEKPFYGIELVYFYTDRTFSHSEELLIPADENIDLDVLVKTMKVQNHQRV
jgi:RNA polymerase subunit RPABC4/transcription elongation factor Spt4